MESDCDADSTPSEGSRGEGFRMCGWGSNDVVRVFIAGRGGGGMLLLLSLYEGIRSSEGRCEVGGGEDGGGSLSEGWAGGIDGVGDMSSVSCGRAKRCVAHSSSGC